MDLKALMQTLEIIDKKQNLMEAEKKETTWTDKSGKKHPATQVKGDKYTGKEAEKDAKKKDVDESRFTSGIAQALLREFGLEEAPVTNPWANDPAKSAAWSALSPQDQAWLGGADPTDPYILARAPNKGKPATVAPTRSMAPQKMDPNQADKDDAQMGADGRAMAAGGNSTSAATGVGNPGEQAAAQAAQDPAQDQYGNNIPIPSTQTVTPDKKPEADPKKKQMAPVDPGTVELQKWIASKGYDIGKFGADGRWGPSTNKALDAFMADWKAGKISEPDKQLYQKLLGGAKDTDWTRQWFAKANAASGGQAAQPAAGGKGPTVAAAQGQQPGNPLNQQPGGQAAQPAANPEVAKIDSEIKRFSSGNNMSLQANKDYVAGLEKKKAAASGGQAAQPAPAAPAPAPTRGGSTPVAKQQPKAAPAPSGQAAQPAAAPAGKVDLSVNNPAMNPANNAPLPTPGTAPAGQLSPQQILAQQQIARAKAKAAAVAPDGNGSGTLQGGQVAQRESVQSQDDLILARIRNALYR